MLPIAQCPASLAPLAQAVQQHYQDKLTAMNGFEIASFGLVTFVVGLNGCEICNQDHGEPVRVVADLKVRKWYQKCNSRRGDEVEFPAEIGSLSMVNVGELVNGSFPAASPSAHVLLSFAQAAFRVGRTAPSIPDPDAAAVVYRNNKRYIVALPTTCNDDGGLHVLEIGRDGVAIRCRGRACTIRGRRWERPSRSSVGVKWDLRFLFPDVDVEDGEEELPVEDEERAVERRKRTYMEVFCDEQNEKMDRLIESTEKLKRAVKRLIKRVK